MRIKNHFRRAAGVTLVALTLGACEFISPVESNPNAVPEATVDQLFTGAQVVSYFLSHGGLSRIAAIWTQQMAGTDRQFATFDQYVITDADFEDEFNSLYTQGGLIDIRSGIAQAEAAGRTAYAGILKVHEAYLVGLIASFYGDIPYSQAVNPDIDAPILDDQAAVYAAVQSLLDDAITDLAGGGASPGSVDRNFAGNVARWAAVAYTLKARFHMHWAEVNGATAYSAALAAAANGVQTTAGTWKSQFGTAQTEANLWTQFLVDRSGYVSSGDFLVPYMVNTGDPRIGIYYSEASPGVYTARVSELADPGYGAADYDLPIVSCAETFFIIAEAEFNVGTEAAARAAARSAAACQEAEHGLAADDLGSVTGFAGAGPALLQQIMEQKYVALFLNPEAYNDYKRTCLPAITERASGMPGRLFYSSQERQSNPNVPNTGTDPNDKYNDNDPAPC
ncbi:MAG TPA: SusD/RagB family nutrient-binding outer membrane lipoprotein [Longimicrobiales bacterium]|nr:SusD/RagB family nutrient-binding outer membrane lipoprotein [Longimicrobiales bacterium]